MPSCTHRLAKMQKAASHHQGDSVRVYCFSVCQHILMLK